MLYAVFTLNILAMTILIIGGIVTKSLAVLFGGVEAGINVLSLSFLLYFLKRSALPPDVDHPYGHYKYQNISAIVTSIIMSASVMLILLPSIGRFLEPIKIDEEALYFAVLSLVLPLFSYLLLSWSSKKTGALAIQAETRHLLVDLTDSIIILVGVILAIELNPVFDALAAMAVSFVFIYAIVTNLKSSLTSLIDEGLPKSLIEEVKKISMTVSGVMDSHMVRSRKTLKGYFIDMHLLLDPEISLDKAHEIAHEVERKIKDTVSDFVIADLIIHVEPYKRDKDEEQSVH